MKYIKLFEAFTDDEIVEVQWNLVGAKTDVSLSIGCGVPVTDINKIKEIIKDYHITYVKNKEWSGGPTNREWVRRWHNEFKTTYSLAWHAWKPQIVLTINTKVGIVNLGFSLISKVCNSISIGEDVGESHTQLKKYLKKEVFDKQLCFDEVIIKFDLDVEGDFEYDAMTQNENAREEFFKKMDKIDRFAKHVNRTRLDASNPLYAVKTGNREQDLWDHNYGVALPFRQYIYDLVDDGWKYNMQKDQFYRKINFNKSFPLDIDRKKLHEDLVAQFKRLKFFFENEGFNCHFLLHFNRVSQQEHNPETNRSDKYVFRDIDLEKNSEYRNGRIDYDEDPINSFQAQVEFVII